MKSYNLITRLFFVLLVLIIDVALCTWITIDKNYIYLILLLPLLIGCILYIKTIFDQTQQKISFMFNAIDCNDYSFKFSEHIRNVNERTLNTSLNRIKEIMSNAKQRAIEREKYYELIMNSVRTGIISLSNNGNVYQVNNETKHLLGLNVFTHVNQVRSFAPNLAETLLRIHPGEHLQVSYSNERGEITLSLNASEISYGDKRLKIIAVNDINNALDAKEVESWIKLTRILTHEIMNSLAPITSLSETLLSIHPNKNDELTKGLETINQTSKSLVSFVDSYRKCTRIQSPIKRPFELKPFFEKVTKLICSPDIKVQLHIAPENTMIYADEDLITQVMVNILKNAIQAVNELSDKQIEITSTIDSNENIKIEISDNGKAIPKDITEDIFMPFFTTKTNGSGIGLSISRQIMHLHGGNIRLTSNKDKKVTFTLYFT